VIENDEQLKATLVDAPFKSETDTEVIVQLMEKNFVELGDVEAAFRKTLSMLHGSYAIAMIDSRTVSASTSEEQVTAPRRSR
jgi:glucosamine--fructose-6-phosphate aminotransferase (isomerizing)